MPRWRFTPSGVAAQSVGVKPADLPDLTIKEVKVYVTDLGRYHSLNGEHGELVSIVTNSGIEGNYTLGNRNPTPNWLEWAKANLVGKNLMELLPTLTSTSGLRGTYGFNGGIHLRRAPRSALAGWEHISARDRRKHLARPSTGTWSAAG